MMKFEDFLMRPGETQFRRMALEEEVQELQEKLNGELKLNTVLRYALTGPVFSCPCLSSLLPFKVQVLLAELAMVEEEINWLETKLDKLRLGLYREKELNNELEIKQPRKYHQARLPCSQQHQGELRDLEWLSAKLSHNRKIILEEGRHSLNTALDMQSYSSTRYTDEIAHGSLSIIRNKQNDAVDAEVASEEPNRLSEELVKCLITIFSKEKQTRSENERTTNATKHTRSSISPKGFTHKTSFNCKTRSSVNKDSAAYIDPYGILQDSDGAGSHVGPYKNYFNITRNLLKAAHLSDSNQATRKLSVLLQRLCYVDLTLLNYKQKLAFWINIYNACIMHAYLQHGLPSTQEKMLTLLNKAAINVGGIVLNALAIEHYILRHPSDSRYNATEENEMLLRHTYGLQYPEPNITFALCRGNWSSPALRVYTPEEVVDELGRAKVEYLEASVRVTSKKRILVPKLLQWHMHDFADDMESLIEWIYSQLPPNGLLKRAMMECLNGDTKLPTGKMIEIAPYEYEFRYLLPH